MAGPIIKTRAELIQYVLRKLGSPVVNVELTAEQLDDAVNDTLDDFLPRAYSGVEERFILMQVDAGVQEYTLPYEVQAVLSVHDGPSDMFNTSHSDVFSLNQFIAADIFRGGVSKIDLVSYELINELVSTMQVLFSRKQTFDFNAISKKLFLFETPATTAGMILHVYRRVEPLSDPADPTAEKTNVYDVKWIKRMAVERSRYQWGVNLMKYAGSVLPNGMQLNADAIKATAEAEIEKLMAELHDEWELPIDFFIG